MLWLCVFILSILNKNTYYPFDINFFVFLLNNNTNLNIYSYDRMVGDSHIL